jgi:hypothetical protein
MENFKVICEIFFTGPSLKTTVANRSQYFFFFFFLKSRHFCPLSVLIISPCFDFNMETPPHDFSMCSPPPSTGY